MAWGLPWFTMVYDIYPNGWYLNSIFIPLLVNISISWLRFHDRLRSSLSVAGITITLVVQVKKGQASSQDSAFSLKLLMRCQLENDTWQDLYIHGFTRLVLPYFMEKSMVSCKFSLKPIHCFADSSELLSGTCAFRRSLGSPVPWPDQAVGMGGLTVWPSDLFLWGKQNRTSSVNMPLHAIRTLSSSHVYRFWKTIPILFF